ncbi:head GIN domain-containing protein [Pedobacter aquatilis]|uniref:head GIN domain-containing protein n=1 Tax=Pedobacter aquatilis TaxID=351343 RepID=UPI00292D21E9|nr:head GIN domain-containing protein [Pedobacter aquatilis]
MKNFLRTGATVLLMIAASHITKAQESKNVAVKSFNSITVSSGIDLYLTQNGSESLTIKANADLLKNVVVEQNGGNLVIKMKEGLNWSSMFRNQSIKAYVNFKTLAALTASGGSDVFSQGLIKADKFALRSSGGSDVKLNLACTDLELQTSGGSDVSLTGKAENMVLNTSGGSDVDAYGFVVSYAKVNASGGSDANIHVTKGLEAGASGGSDVHYKGNASLKKTSSSKSGDVTKVD